MCACNKEKATKQAAGATCQSQTQTVPEPAQKHQLKEANAMHEKHIKGRNKNPSKWGIVDPDVGKPVGDNSSSVCKNPLLQDLKHGHFQGRSREKNKSCTWGIKNPSIGTPHPAFAAGVTASLDELRAFLATLQSSGSISPPIDHLQRICLHGTSRTGCGPTQRRQ